jgi:S-adenosylmethionine decarboxylase
MKMFTQSYGLNAEQLTQKTGIADLLPGAVLDAFLFEPCGYSMNGILPNGGYFTIHITPEEDFSYVSFETNVQQDSYSELISNVIDMFKPRKFLTTVLANEESPLFESKRCADKFEDYKQVDHQFCLMKNYYLTYSQYIRSNINGLSPPQ